MGGFGDVYRGRLFDKSQVAIKTMRIHINADKTRNPLKVFSSLVQPVPRI